MTKHPASTRRDGCRVTLADAEREFVGAPVAVDDRDLPGGRGGRPRRRRRLAGPGGSWSPAWRCWRPFPVIEWVIHVGILHWRPRRVGPVRVDSLLARKHREHHADPRDLAAGLHPVAGAGLAAARVRRGRAAGVPARRAGLTFLRRPRHGRARLRVDPLPGAQRLPAAVARVPLGLAQPPAAPLQERALLVHRHHRRHRRPASRHLPRPRDGPDLADGEEPARTPLTTLLPVRVTAGYSRPAYWEGSG